MTASNPSSAQRARTAGLIALVLIGLFELSLRLVEPELPPLEMWPTTEVAAKVEQIESLIEGGEKMDVVFLGSSVVAEGIDPVAFNAAASKTAYNAALGAASMRSSEAWIGDVVSPLTGAKTVVVGVTVRDLNDNGISQTEFYDRLSTSPGLLTTRTPNNPLEHVEGWLVAHSAIFRLRPLLRDPRLLFQQVLGPPPADASPEDTVVGPYGSDTSYEGESYDASDKWRIPWEARQMNDFAIGGMEAEALQRLIRKLTNTGSDVILINMPVTDDFYATLPDPERNRVDHERILRDVAEDTGAIYLDLDERFSLEDFRDPAHLKPAAAAELAEMLAAMVTG
jgi:hypothetical protein